MNRFKHSLLLAAFFAGGALAQASGDVPWSVVPESRPAGEAPPVQVLADRAPLGLPNESSRLSMATPLGQQPRAGVGRPEDGEGAFSWSLRAWQLNTASLAHIQCSQGMLTVDSYLAQDCRFVDRPLPDDSVNLVQVSGDWVAAPGLQFGVSAFRGDDSPSRNEPSFTYDLSQEMRPADMRKPRAGAMEGLDVNVSFGIETDRIGDFLVGLQLARYRQRMGLAELSLASPGSASPSPELAGDQTHYGNSAHVLLGWRRGSFSGEMLGHHRELPLWLAGEQAPSTLNSFDLEFSWHAPRNASFSIGVSNVMDAAPRAEEAANDDSGLEDPVESVYGRIPYVRYKQDL